MKKVDPKGTIPEQGPGRFYGVYPGRVKKVNDPDQYKKYADQVPAILAKHGGKVLARGGRFQIITIGGWPGE